MIYAPLSTAKRRLLYLFAVAAIAVLAVLSFAPNPASAHHRGSNEYCDRLEDDMDKARENAQPALWNDLFLAYYYAECGVWGPDGHQIPEDAWIPGPGPTDPGDGGGGSPGPDEDEDPSPAPAPPDDGIGKPTEETFNP